MSQRVVDVFQVGTGNIREVGNIPRVLFFTSVEKEILSQSAGLERHLRHISLHMSSFRYQLCNFQEFIPQPLSA